MIKFKTCMPTKKTLKKKQFKAKFTERKRYAKYHGRIENLCEKYGFLLPLHTFF